MEKEELIDALISIFLEGADCQIIKKDGEVIHIVAGSLAMFKDPIKGKTSEGEDVVIFLKDIAKI